MGQVGKDCWVMGQVEKGLVGDGRGGKRID